MKDYENILTLAGNLESFFIRNESQNTIVIKDLLEKAISNSNSWFDKFGDLTSRLNIHMHLLQKINEIYDIKKYYENPEFVKIVIDDTGLTNIGEHINIKGKDYEIINRFIGNNFSVIFVMKSNDGETFSHEFYDY